MHDPGARFKVEDYDGGVGPNGWNPIEYRQDGFPNVYERDEDGLGIETIDFLRTWDNNLSSQGMYEMARDGRLQLDEEPV